MTRKKRKQRTLGYVECIDSSYCNLTRNKAKINFKGRRQRFTVVLDAYDMRRLAEIVHGHWRAMDSGAQSHQRSADAIIEAMGHDG